MIYGLYLSATGILTNSYRIDVLSNNLANAETVGFKRDMPLFRERLTEAQERGKGRDWSDPMLEHLGGGVFANPNLVDNRQGDLEHTGSKFDVAIDGDGYFAAADGAETRLTRDGRFMMDHGGNLIFANSEGKRVLDDKRKPILLKPSAKSTSIGRDGVVTQDGQAVATIGMFDVPDKSKLRKQGSNMMSYPNTNELRPAAGTLQNEFVERANVDPAVELTALMDAQRQLEANANMIRYQDQMLQRLCNDVGKIS